MLCVLTISVLGQVVLTFQPSGLQIPDKEIGNFKVLSEFPKVQDHSLLNGAKLLEIA